MVDIYRKPMTSPLPSAQPRLAAIDVGTNTIRLIVAEVQDDDTYRILDEEREMVRLGEHLDRTGRLSDEAVERALAAIGKMKAIADGFKVTEHPGDRHERGPGGGQRAGLHPGSPAAA